MNTENKIISKTIKIINHEGYESLSLRKLTQTLNLTTGAFYKHFENKNELFTKVRIQLSKDFIEHVPLDESKPAKEQLLTIAKYFCREVEVHTNIMNFLLFNSPVAYQADSDFVFLNKMMELVDQINTKKKISNEDLLTQIWSFIQGYALLIKNGATKYNAHLVDTTLSEFMKEE